MSKPYTTVRIVPHEESFEVRVSTYFSFDGDAGRRAVSGRVDQETAKKQAQEFARAARDRTRS
jgi:hypothetical protein